MLFTPKLGKQKLGSRVSLKSKTPGGCYDVEVILSFVWRTVYRQNWQQ